MNFIKPTMEIAGRSSSCPKLEPRQADIDTTINASSSLPTSLTEDWKNRNHESVSIRTPSMEGNNSNDYHKLVQNCGPDCMITQRIVDRLLARMLHLENERSELLAANRSWAVQFQMMQERHETEISKLDEQLKEANRDDHVTKAGANPVSRDQLNLLTHQAEVYREDFMEERKARVRAHAQMDALRNELKRERKSRAKLSAIVQQTRNCDATEQALA